MKKFLLYLMSILVVGMGWINGMNGFVRANEPNDMASENEEDMEEDDEDEPTMSDDIPELYIRAVNPGYTIDGKSNVGELIEISRKNFDAPFLLAGTAVGYTNSSGNYSVLFEFPENSWMTGESILLRLASSPDSELASVNYKKTLAFKAGIVLKQGDDTVDEVCWTSKEGCYKEFTSSKHTTLVRNLETGKFEHMLEYEALYDANAYHIEQSKEEEGYGALPSQCRGMEFSEILSYYETSVEEQFVELYNRSAEQIRLDGCQLRYKNKNYRLSGIVQPEEYYVYYPKGFRLTKNPTNSNTLELVDTDTKTLDTLKYSNGQRKGTSYALIGFDGKGEEIWKVTYAPTPGAPNNYQEFKTCVEGKVLNKVTGNCVKVASVKTTICKPGQYLNVLTGRCRKIQTTQEKKCKEGYYLNPETNRCKKIKENKGADYSVKPEEYEENSSFVALYAVLGVMGAGGLYLVYEFRRDIKKLFGKVFRLFH